MDAYDLTEHYHRWEEDLERIASLGVSCVRYGTPWHRICPQAGRYDWEWTDRVLDRLVNTHGIEPIIDLVHYGTPLWMHQSFLDPDYPQHVADYAHAFAGRYRGLCFWYTPLNEPRVNAWYSGRLGWWPPYLRSWTGFVRVLAQLCRGICRTQQAIRSVAPEARCVHVDATDLYVAQDPGLPDLEAEAVRRQEIVFLALDLVMGRITEDHTLAPWLCSHGMLPAELDWFRTHAVTPDVIGYNMYPMFSRKVVRREGGGRLRVRIQPCWTETLTALTWMYAGRYSPLPIMVTETAAWGSMARRTAWIRESTEAVLAARSAGAPVIGYTFWPLYSLVAWSYQIGRRPRDTCLVNMGLWDLHPGPAGLERVSTPAVDAYRQAVSLRPERSPRDENIM